MYRLPNTKRWHKGAVFLVALIGFVCLVARAYVETERGVAKQWGLRRGSYRPVQLVTSPAKTNAISERPLRIALINTPDTTHLEVLLPLLHAFAQYRHAFIDVFVTANVSSLDITDLLVEEDFTASVHIHPLEDLERIPYTPDVAVLTTCANDFSRIPNSLRNVTSKTAPKELVCVVHHAHNWADNEWYKNLARPWVQKSRFNFFALSDHVTNDLAEHLHLDNVSRRTPTPPPSTYEIPLPRLLPAFPPVFTTPLSSKLIPCLTIQGTFDPARRNYTALFTSMRKHRPTLSEKGAFVRVIGSGRQPRVPPDLRSFVTFYTNLPFHQYWRVLSECIAISPSFATSRYLDDTASSTVGTSVVVGTPLIASNALRKAYTYLTERASSGREEITRMAGHETEVTWEQQDGETEFDTYMRVLDLGPSRWREVKTVVHRRRREIIAENVEMVRMFLEGVRARIEWGKRKGLFS